MKTITIELEDTSLKYHTDNGNGELLGTIEVIGILEMVKTSLQGAIMVEHFVETMNAKKEARTSIKEIPIIA